MDEPRILHREGGGENRLRDSGQRAQASDALLGPNIPVFLVTLLIQAVRQALIESLPCLELPLAWGIHKGTGCEGKGPVTALGPLI